MAGATHMATAPLATHHHPLLARARDPRDSVVLTFVAAIDLARGSARLAGRAALGLDAHEFGQLLDQYFPGAAPLYLTPALRASLALQRGNRQPVTDEFADLLQLLLEHRADQGPVNRWLAFAIATCCFGDDHLWQDMGLPNRQALSDLLACWFPLLHARNTGGMRWKKFFYKQLCERDGAFVCRSPSCADCVEYSQCFGSEEESSWQAATY